PEGAAHIGILEMNEKQSQLMQLRLDAAKAFKAQQIVDCEKKIESARQALVAAEAKLKEWRQAIPNDVMVYQLEQELAKTKAKEENDIIEKIEAIHIAAVLKAFRTGKALLPASSGKLSSFLVYGSLAGMLILYLATLAWSIYGLWQVIACLSGFAAGFLIG